MIDDRRSQERLSPFEVTIMRNLRYESCCVEEDSKQAIETIN